MIHTNRITLFLSFETYDSILAYTMSEATQLLRRGVPDALYRGWQQTSSPPS